MSSINYKFLTLKEDLLDESSDYLEKNSQEEFYKIF